MDIEPLLGPYGLTVALVVAVGWLWRTHLKNDDDRIADLRSQRDAAQQFAREAIEGLRVVTNGQDDLHEAFLEFVRAQASRRRDVD